MNAEDYNRVNRFQMREAKLLINRIKDDFKDKDIDCILDIGCGPGNITILLNEMKVKRIIGIDLDHNMIQFAQQNNNSNNNNNIQYLTQDFGVDWNDLRSELKEIEGKVSLIFSNYCLHWIYTNKENVIKNMNRLLATNARIYTNITCMPNPINRTQNELVTSILSKFSSFPSKETQEKEWTQTFEKIGFSIIEYKYNETTFSYECQEFDSIIAPMGFPIYQQFYGHFMTVFRQLSRIISLFGVRPSSYFPQFKDENTGQVMCEVDLQSFLYIVCKNRTEFE